MLNPPPLQLRPTSHPAHFLCRLCSISHSLGLCCFNPISFNIPYTHSQPSGATQLFISYSILPTHLLLAHQRAYTARNLCVLYIIKTDRSVWMSATHRGNLRRFICDVYIYLYLAINTEGILDTLYVWIYLYLTINKLSYSSLFYSYLFCLYWPHIV